MAYESSKDPQNTRETVAARGGETGHNVRYVLAFALIGVVVAFAIILLASS